MAETVSVTRKITVDPITGETEETIYENRSTENVDVTTTELTGRGTYTTFRPGDIVPNIKQTITSAVWTNSSGSLTSFFTSSAQSASSGDYYYDVYHLDPSNSLAEVQFAIAYGHRFGSGSTQINDNSGDTGLSPSRAIYSQYRNFLLDSDTSQFTIGSSTTDQILAINLERARCPETLDEGNWEISFLQSSSLLRQYIDDSSINSSPSTNEGGTYYNIVSGTIDGGVYNSSSPEYVGVVYPEHSLLIFDAVTLASASGLDIVSASATDGNNHGKALTAISAAAALNDDYAFKARNEEQIRSSYYFCRLRNSDYNFSLNPSFYSGSDARIRHDDMINNPQTYVTTVGLYNDNNELLAIAKLSQPFRKNFHREASVRIKIDW